MNTLFCEDVVVGQNYVSPGRTVTEADLTIFNMVSGDWNPIQHPDRGDRVPDCAPDGGRYP